MNAYLADTLGFSLLCMIIGVLAGVTAAALGGPLAFAGGVAVVSLALLAVFILWIVIPWEYR